MSIVEKCLIKGIVPLREEKGARKEETRKGVGPSRDADRAHLLLCILCPSKKEKNIICENNIYKIYTSNIGSEKRKHTKGLSSLTNGVKNRDTPTRRRYAYSAQRAGEMMRRLWLHFLKCGSGKRKNSLLSWPLRK